jgi:uncharacterized repeat protein (TIGR04138 family)
MQATTFEEALDQILAKNPRYHRDAYIFLRDALDHTRRMLDREKREKTDKPGKRTAVKEQHVSGQELLAGIRELALELFGPMTVTVFAEWGIHGCADFGEMVFIMVENEMFKKTEKDSRADFENGYDFYETFQKPFLPRGRTTEILPEPKVAGA